MNNQSLLYGVIGLLLGVVLTTYAASNAVNTGNTGMMRMMGMRASGQTMEKAHDTSMSMDDMMASMMEKTGDDFDRAFIESMIIHHQGAINMATVAKQQAKHDEVKTLAGDIIEAQTKEINMMRQWQVQWGY